MASRITIYSKSAEDTDWMKDNYDLVNKKFEKIHPEFKSEYGKFKHGVYPCVGSINNSEKNDYVWVIGCHWDNDGHVIQTENNIQQILTEMHAPEGLGVCVAEI